MKNKCFSVRWPPALSQWNWLEKQTPEHPEGKLHLARLDVSGSVLGERTHVDCSFTDAATTQVEERALRARVDGHAAQLRVKDKLCDYPRSKNPHEGMVPFVIEALGRPSEDAVRFLRTLAPTEPRQRARVLPEVWRRISLITQRRLAELYLSAERPRPPR